jgi:glycosyltransferase involved in cell wall biosynthesis
MLSVSTHRDNAVHVLHVVPGLGAGGMELAMSRVITGLTDRGVRHSIACLKGEAEIADRLPSQTEIACLHSRPNEPQLPARLAKLIRRFRPTVIHARNWGAWPDVALGRLLHWPVVPLIFSFHGLGRSGYMPLRRRVASHVLVRMTTHLFTVSSQSREMLIDHWGWPAGKVDVISNGVDTDRFRPGETHTPGKTTIIGTVGNLRPVKNHAMLLRACAKLAARGADVELRIAGEGTERTDLEALSGELGFAERLKLPGRVEDVPGFLHELDLFVLSSDSEQHPNALNEAMACGLPCVSTRVGCVDELLDGGRCGGIVEPGDTEALTDELSRMLSDESLRRARATAGHDRAVNDYSMDRMLDAYERLYRRFGSPRGCVA